MSQIPEPTPPISENNAPNGGNAPIGKTQKIINIALWSLLGVVVVVVIAGKLEHRQRQALPCLFQAPAFALTDQDGKPFSNVDLRGKPYICDFIFTTCGSACPMMSHKLAELQSQTPASVHLVSFTVNPEHDTPAVLKEYAATYGADLTRWHFLTGTPKQMAETIRGMNLSSTPATESSPIEHDERFLLIDADGNVRGIYHSNDPEKMQAIVTDTIWLATSPGGRGW